MRKRLSYGLLVAALLGGCTSSLDVRRFDPSIAQVGYPYRLRMTQYKVAVTWRVVSCTPGVPDANKVRISAEITDATDLDPSEFYIIDPRKLQGMFRTTEFNMDWYEDRTPKSISSSVDDQTGAAIGNVITGVGKLAGAGLLPFGPESNVCSSEVVKALTGIPAEKAKVARAQQTVDALTAALAGLMLKATAAGALLDDGARRRLGAAGDRLDAAKIVLALAQGKLKAVTDVVTDVQTVTWPERGDEFERSEPIRPSDDAMARWNASTSSAGVLVSLRLDRLDWGAYRVAARPRRPAADGTDGVGSTPGGTPILRDDPTESTAGTLSTRAQDPSSLPGESVLTPAGVREQPVMQAAAASAAPPRRGDARASMPGLPYREPARVLLLVCRGASCDGAAVALRSGGRIIAEKNGLALQGGTMLYAPFRSQTFANIRNSVGFSQAGVLVSAETSQLRGAGSGAADSVKTVTEAASGAVDAARGADAKRTQAVTAEVKAKNDLTAARAAAGANPNADDQALIAAYQSDAILATAEKTKLEAEAAVAAARALLGR